MIAASFPSCWLGTPSNVSLWSLTALNSNFPTSTPTTHFCPTRDAASASTSTLLTDTLQYGLLSPAERFPKTKS